MIIRRAGAIPQPSQWYVKGSHVLDAVLGTARGKDVDVFYLGDKPSDGDLSQWLVAHGLPPAPVKELEQFTRTGTKIVRKPLFDCHHVDSLAVPDGGGDLTFNVDCWYIPMGGLVHIFDPATGTSTPANQGQTPGPLALLAPARDVPTEPGVKGLLKMLLYPTLRDDAVCARLVADAAKDLAARPGGTQAEQAVTCLDEMLRGARPDDPAAARAAVKLAEDELRGR